MEAEDSYTVLRNALLQQDKKKRKQILCDLIEQSTDVNRHNSNGRNLLHLVVRYGDAECARLLLEAGANVNELDEEGLTPLMANACYNGYVECMRVLLEADANVNESGVRGKTALIYATSNRHVGCVSLLLEANANVNQPDLGGGTALIKAARYGCDDCLIVLLKAGANVNHSDIGGNTALAEAASVGHIECMDLLVEAGADVNQSDEDGQTALMKTVRYKQAESMRALLDAGANVNSVDINGDTALTFCLNYFGSRTSYETKAYLKLIINAGVDIHVQNKRHLQPIHYALSRWQRFKFQVEYLISENCNLSQASYDQVMAVGKHTLTEEDRLNILKLLFACGLPRYLCKSFIIEQETFIKNWIETVASQPRTLKSLSVFEIRRNLGLGIKSKVTKLNLPNVIQNLILLKTILDSECFV